MEEGGEVQRGGVFKTLKNFGKALWSSVNTEVPKIDLEKINEQTIANVIQNYLGNPLQEKLGHGRWVNPFSITDVLTYSGYGAVWTETDFMEKYPEEYQRARTSLWNLCKLGILETELAQNDPNKETTHYKVVSPENLEILAKQGLSPEQSQILTAEPKITTQPPVPVPEKSPSPTPQSTPNTLPGSNQLKSSLSSTKI